MLSPTYSASVIKEINTRVCLLWECLPAFLLLNDSEFLYCLCSHSGPECML